MASSFGKSAIDVPLICQRSSNFSANICPNSVTGSLRSFIQTLTATQCQQSTGSSLSSIIPLIPCLQHQSPLQHLHQKHVDYSYFRVFGCLAFASTLSHSHTKFEPRARACVFLGYPIGMKAYKLYYLQTNKKIISRD